MDVHVVVKGDTLWKIARQYGIPFEELKRVNAHLANPDYIVPGMKIFLPAMKKGTMPSNQTPQKPAEKVPLPTEKKPLPPKGTAPPAPAPKPTPQPAPIPLPKPEHQMKPPKPAPPMQKPQSKPEIKPDKKPPTVPAPPAGQPKPLPPVQPQLPMQPETPHTPPMPQMPVMPVPCYQPVIPIPCTWMPIYDADCHPHPMQHGGWQMPAAPAIEPCEDTEPVMPVMPSPKPPIADMDDVMEQYTPPMLPGQAPSAVPMYPHVQGWQMEESPDLPDESPYDAVQDSVYFPPDGAYDPQMMPQMQMPFHPAYMYPAHQQAMPMMPYMAVPQTNYPHMNYGSLCSECHQPTPYTMPYGYGHHSMMPYAGYPAQTVDDQDCGC